MCKAKVTAIVAASLLLSACQERDPDDFGMEDTQAPVITAPSTSTVQEGDTISINFNVVDDLTNYKDLKISLMNKDARGRASLDLSNKALVYTAPWLSRDKTLQENILIRATDKSGNSSEHTFQITVEDIDSPVSIRVMDPSLGFGFDNGRTPESMYLWVEESRGALNLRVAVDEEDGDEVSVDYSVDSSVLHESAVNASFNSEQTELNLKFDIPAISGVPYEHIALALTVEDNDAVSEATIGVTVVNNPSFRILPSDDITESRGGVIPFEFSEPADYPGDYQVNFTDTNGEQLPFNINYSLDRANGEIVIGTSEPFQGDRQVNVEVSVTNEIRNLNGDNYSHVATGRATITIIDDRDDDFSSAVESFDTIKNWVNDMEARKDEYIITQLMSRYFLLEGMTTYSETQALDNEVLRLLEEDYDALRLTISNVEDSISNGDDNTEVTRLINKFNQQLSKTGQPSRELALDWYNTVTEGVDPDDIPIRAMNAQAKMLVLDDYDAVTHFVGNENYGRYRNNGGGAWSFNDKMAYFTIADVSGPGCY